MYPKIVILSLFLPLAIYAQSPEKGSLVDGTPFRVDAEGTQIIDYVAQLEQSVDHLKDRVYALEMDLESRQLTIDKLKSGKYECNDEIKARPIIAEKSLIDPEVLKSKEYAALEGEVLRLNDDLRLREQRISELEKQLLATAPDLATPFNEADSTDPQDELLTLDAQIAKRKQELALVEDKIQQVAKSGLSKEELQRRVQQSIKAQQMRDQERRAAFASKRLRAFENARETLQDDLKRLNPMVKEREALYAEYQKVSSSGVKFELSALETERGNSIASLSKKLSSIASPAELAFYKQEISQLRSKLREDIALIKRLTNLNQ
ncbi:MAG: hypothetical protein H6619_06535 [Deltaproteobacteria bacterium]|nr:hypothetical protein [Deltaproteobacteria bacterium]